MPVQVFKPGDYQQTALESWISEYPEFCIIASGADFNNFRQQLLDTAAFIHANKQELLRPSQIPGIVSCFFDFSLEPELFQEDVWVDSFPFPVDFMRLLCEVGASMEILYYSSSGG